jgi:hypothetical protein
MAQPDLDHEALLGRTAVRVVALLAVPMVGVAWALRGPDAALTALGGLALVALGQWVTGRSLSWAARRSLTTLHVVTLGGFLLRLAVYAALIITLAPTGLVDGPALAASVAVAVIAVLAVETRMVLRDGSFWWLDATAATPGSTVTASAATTAKDLA